MITSGIVSNGRFIRRIAFYGLFFVIACLQGYRLGTGDLDTYLPFVYHESDSSLFKNDLLMEQSMCIRFNMESNGRTDSYYTCFHPLSSCIFSPDFHDYDWPHSFLP